MNGGISWNRSCLQTEPCLGLGAFIKLGSFASGQFALIIFQSSLATGNLQATLFPTRHVLSSLSFFLPNKRTQIQEMVKTPSSQAVLRSMC